MQATLQGTFQKKFSHKYRLLFGTLIKKFFSQIQATLQGTFIKKIYLLAAHWDTFIKKNFHNYKKNFSQL